MASLAGTQFLGELTFAWSYEREGYEGSKASMSCKVANPDSMDSSLINSSHVCRICKREFSSGRALGGHMRAHGSIALENANRGQVWKDQANKTSGNSSSAQNNQIRFRAHAEEGSSPYLGSSCKNNISRSCSSPGDQIFKGKKKFMTGSEDQEADSMRLSSSSDQFFLKKKGYGDPLYGLRRNPKRSRRFVDHEYAMEIASGAPAGKKGGLILQDKAQACTECGKEFSSWKALFGHMRCHPEREWRGIHRPGVEKKLANSRRIMGSLVPAESESESKHTSKISDNGSDTESIEAAYMNGSTGSSFKFEKIRGKGKRSKRSRKYEDPTTPKEIKEAQDMADCLVLLACAGESTGLLENKSDSEDTVSERDETGNWNGFEHVGRKGFYSKTEIDDSSLCGDGFSEEMNDSRIKYECSTCKKVFKTHQALGGHRASHKRVKGCFARTYNGHEEVQESFADEEILTDDEFGFPVRPDGQIGRSEERFGQCYEIEESFGRKMKSHHECSICHRVFNSGQALGGHKRCHWGISGNEKFDAGSNSASSSRQSVLVSNSNPPKISNPAKQLRNGKIELLDLNLPAPVEDEDEEQNYDTEAVELGLNLPRLVPAYEFKLSCQVLDQSHGRECFSSSLCLNPAF